jgi:hypothetical protein
VKTQSGDLEMKYFAPLAISIVVLGMSPGWTTTSAIAQEARAKNCRMEQQCKWVNFKKICTYVKVCR